MVVEPSQTDTDMWRTADDMVADVESGLSAEHRALYAKHVAGMKRFVPVARKMAVPTSKVVAVVVEALTARRPKARYLVGLGNRAQVALMTNTLPPFGIGFWRRSSGCRAGRDGRVRQTSPACAARILQAEAAGLRWFAAAGGCGASR